MIIFQLKQNEIINRFINIIMDSQLIQTPNLAAHILIGIWSGHKE